MYVLIVNIQMIVKMTTKKVRRFFEILMYTRHKSYVGVGVSLSEWS